MSVYVEKDPLSAPKSLSKNLGIQGSRHRAF